MAPTTDVDALVRYADNRRVWLTLGDRFPNPYTRADAQAWIAQCAEQEKPTHLAIEVGDGPVGGVGFDVLGDVRRLTAEVGYWLGEPFWGRGLATIAARALTDYAFENFALERLQATVFAWNPASARVMEKAGYTFEGRMRRQIVKDGRIGDGLVYSRLRSEHEARSRS